MFGIDSSDIQGPLVQFQATRYNEEDIRKLLKNINNLIGNDKLKEDVFNNVFDKWWPELYEEVNTIMEKHKESPEGEEIRSDREILQEILALTRNTTRQTRRPTISQGALDHLVGITHKLNKLIRETGPNDEIKNTLIELNSPIKYLISRSHDREWSRRLYQNLEELENQLSHSSKEDELEFE